MKNLNYGKCLLVLPLFVVLLFSSSAGASEEGGAMPTWGADVDFRYNYIWKGMSFGKGLLVQPGLWISYKGFSAGVWNSLLAYDADAAGVHETDLYASGDWSNDDWFAGALFEYYIYYADLGSNSGGITLKGGRFLGDFVLSLEQYLDIIAAPGSYAGQLQTTWNHNLFDESLYLESSLKIGWGSADFHDYNAGVDKFTVTHASLAFKSFYYPWGPLYIGPQAELAVLVDPDIRDALGNLEWDVGLAIGFELGGSEGGDE